MIELHYVGNDLRPVDVANCGCSDQLGRMVYALVAWHQDWLKAEQETHAKGLVCQAREIVDRHIQTVTWKNLPEPLTDEEVGAMGQADASDEG